jgi:secreted Zn-dependent insulinase-like peptidase
LRPFLLPFFAQNQCTLAKPGHLLRKFSWGNLATLKKSPKKLKVDVYDLLVAFHAMHYKPSNMKLAIIAPQPLSALRAAVENSFGHWGPASTRVGLQLPSEQGLAVVSKAHATYMNLVAAPLSEQLPFEPHVFGKLTRIVPLRQFHRLSLRFVSALAALRS